MYLTGMIKVLPTQSGRYLAPAAALSHVLKRQQHRPETQGGLKKETLQSVHGSLCQALEKCPGCLSPRSFLQASGACRHRGLDGGRPPPAQPTLAEVHPSPMQPPTATGTCLSHLVHTEGRPRVGPVSVTLSSGLGPLKKALVTFRG